MNKKLLAVAISGALTIPMAAQAIEFSTSGHVNRMVRFADDGIASDVQHVDSDSSRSRIRWKGSQDIGGGFEGRYQHRNHRGIQPEFAYPAQEGWRVGAPFDGQCCFRSASYSGSGDGSR